MVKSVNLCSGVYRMYCACCAWAEKAGGVRVNHDAGWLAWDIGPSVSL